MTAKGTANKRMALSQNPNRKRYSSEELEQSAIEAKKLANKRKEFTDENGVTWVCVGVSRFHPVWTPKEHANG